MIKSWGNLSIHQQLFRWEVVHKWRHGLRGGVSWILRRQYKSLITKKRDNRGRSVKNYRQLRDVINGRPLIRVSFETLTISLTLCRQVEKAEFEVEVNDYVQRRTINVKEKVDVPRIFVQGKFRVRKPWLALIYNN